MSISKHKNDLPKVIMPTCSVDKVLQGQKALVTGASSGIGKGIAIALGQAGAEVVVNYVAGDEAAEQVVQEIKAAGGQALAHKADVSDERQVKEMS